MTFYDRQIIFLKVAGERGTADNIGTAVMINDILKVGSSLFDEPLTDRIGKIAGIFTDHEKMEPIIFLTGLLHQITVSQGKGIGIHYNSSNAPLGRLFSRQVIQIAGKAIRVLFHKNNLIWHPGNFMETQISKKEG